jgi:hypothetical protein
MRMMELDGGARMACSGAALERQGGLHARGNGGAPFMGDRQRMGVRRLSLEASEGTQGGGDSGARTACHQRMTRVGPARRVCVVHTWQAQASRPSGRARPQKSWPRAQGLAGARTPRRAGATRGADNAGAGRAASHTSPLFGAPEAVWTPVNTRLTARFSKI